MAANEASEGGSGRVIRVSGPVFVSSMSPVHPHLPATDPSCLPLFLTPFKMRKEGNSGCPVLLCGDLMENVGSLRCMPLQLGDRGVPEGFEHQASISVFLPRVCCHGPHRGPGAWIGWSPAAVLPVVGGGGGEGTHQL